MVTVLGGVILEAQNRKCQARPWQAVSPNQCKGQLVLLTVPTNRAAEGVRGAGSAHWGFLFRLGMLPPDCFQCSMKNSQCPGSNCLTPHLVNKTNCNMKDVSVSLQHSPTDLSTVSSAGLQVEHSYPSPFHSQPPRNVKQNPATSINLHSTSCKATNPHYFGTYKWLSQSFCCPCGCFLAGPCLLTGIGSVPGRTKSGWNRSRVHLFHPKLL